MDLIALSQQLLKAVKTDQDVAIYKNQLTDFSLGRLLISLKTDEQKKAFWINIYNAYATILLKPNPELILCSLKRKKFFNKVQISIANQQFSLNDIEHNILRKSRVWWSKGYLKKWWENELEKQLRVNKLDPRIHFALNCGGRGCPPIRYYEVANINDQLDMATQAFLFSETEKDKDKNIIKISRLFNWYIGDFGGKSGIVSFLKEHHIIGFSDNPTIVYNNYNWEPWLKVKKTI